MSPHELSTRINAGNPPAILDVRTPGEFEKGHVPGAVNVPFNQVRKRAAEIPGARDEELVVYCGHGPRAYVAGAMLRRLGWQKISYLKGHWAKWKDHHEATKGEP